MQRGHSWNQSRVKDIHVFHEGRNDFQGTDLAEHKIVTGDAKPI